MSQYVFNLLLKSGIVVVYGEKNVGKTTFLLQLSQRLSKERFMIIYIFGLKQLKKFHSSLLSELELSRTFLKIISDSYDPEALKNKLTGIVNNKFAVFIDMPYELLERGVSELAKILFISRMLSKLLRDIIFVFSVFENLSEGIPFFFSFFLKYYVDLYIRIERVSRLRLIRCYNYDYTRGILVELCSEKALLTRLGFIKTMI